MSSRRTVAIFLLPVVASMAMPDIPRASAQAAGNAEAGGAVFVSKRCDRCHRSKGEHGTGPALEELRRPQGAFELAGRLWNHAPAMFAALSQQGLEWPQISSSEMSDLMAYLQADPARDPSPDLFKGRVALVRKGCLKCHALRGEGARIGPDLADHRADYESPVEWATKMWVHTPRMSAKAREVGVLYPRFVGDELDNLLGFLRSAAR